MFDKSEFIREGNGANNEDSAAGSHKKKQAGSQAASRAFDLAFDLRRPVKPRWPEFDIDSAGEPAWMPV